MMSLGPLAFAAPWALAAVLALPVLWWLLRVTPPSPRLQRFPAVRLLFGLSAREDTAARTPWWVLLLRLVLAFCLILAVAHPLVNPGQPAASRSMGPLIVVMDDGWASAADWPERRAWAEQVLAGAERASRPVALLTTAPPADGGPLPPPRLSTAAEARAQIQALEPKPWATDRAAAAEALKALPRDRVTQAVWMADGLEDGGSEALARGLQSLGGGLEVTLGRTARLLLPPAEDAALDRLSLTIRRSPAETTPARLAVVATDGEGRVLGREEASLMPTQAEATVFLRLPTELRNRVVRLGLEGERGAAATVLVDERFRRRPVGLASGAAERSGAPLLDQLYYVEKALAPYAELHQGEVSELLSRQLSMLVLADIPAVLGSTAEKLEAWVAGGGVLVRFAGPVLAQAAAAGGEPDRFLPVRLRAGGRILGGAMSWTSAQGLAPFPDTGPFAGLPAPAEVKVAAQVLAEPSIDLAARTWARLEDGTPLVTADRRGKGWVVLVHSSANAEWSNLALSGLFVDMLRRLALLGEGVAGGSQGPLPPSEVLDGLGRLTAPSAAATALTGDPAQVRPGPRNPPGFYGQAGARVAVNLAPALGRLVPLKPPSGAAVARLGAKPPEIDLRPPLLAAALVLAVLDLLLALGLRGLLRRSTAAAGLAVLASLLASGQGRAADQFSLEAGLKTRLAYVRTGDQALDGKSHRGLAALSRLIGQRSTAQLAEPMGVTLDSDPVLFFPLLYWPVSAAQKPLSAAAADKLNDFMRRGGLVVIDTAEAGFGPDDPRMAERVRAATEGLALPPLAPVTEEHVLTRSFYLLKEMPGRTEPGPVWVEDGQGMDNDGVSPVVVGAADWAGAWAADERGRPLYAAVPGGERQREMAYRFGMNLVMYALTGNYKADQVHLPTIMERLGR